jgi:hypothetical protein
MYINHYTLLIDDIPHAEKIVKKIFPEKASRVIKPCVGAVLCCLATDLSSHHFFVTLVAMPGTVLH